MKPFIKYLTYYSKIRLIIAKCEDMSKKISPRAKL